MKLLNIYVGGYGRTGNQAGYNGGGVASSTSSSGGGATHISKVLGLLSTYGDANHANYNTQDSNILMVAGGAGERGHGGGLIGSKGYDMDWNQQERGLGYGGTQKRGGSTDQHPELSGLFWKRRGWSNNGVGGRIWCWRRGLLWRRGWVAQQWRWGSSYTHPTLTTPIKVGSEWPLFLSLDPWLIIIALMAIRQK